jgi:putative membrane protein
MRLLLIWVINAAALFALPFLMTSIQIDGIGTALIAALVLGLINTLIRPVLVLLTLPVTLLTLGLFILVINGLLFWAAMGGAILYSIISWILSALILKEK